VTMLLAAAAEFQQLLKGQANLMLPEI